MTKVIALDIASRTGAAFTDGTRTIAETWTLPSGNHGAAINELIKRLREFIARHGCDRLVCEDASFGSNNRATAAYHNALRGAIEALAAELGLPPVWKYNPSSLKAQTCNNGRATKQQMIAAVALLYGVKCADDNQADAVAMAMLAIQAIPPVGMVKKAVKRRIRAAKKKERALF